MIDDEEASPIWKLIGSGVFALLLVVLAMCSCGVNCNPGDGTKVGQIVKLSNEGMVWKTWEGQLIRGGMTSGSGTVGTVPFDFTIQDEAVLAAAQKYMDSQTEVIVHYHIRGIFVVASSGSGGGYYVTSIEPAKESTR